MENSACVLNEWSLGISRRKKLESSRETFIAEYILMKVACLQYTSAWIRKRTVYLELFRIFSSDSISKRILNTHSRYISIDGGISISNEKNIVWRGDWGHPLSNQVSRSSLVYPVIQGSEVSLSASHYYIMIPERVLIVKWVRDTFEFDQSNKQAESKMQVTGKISSNK